MKVSPVSTLLSTLILGLSSSKSPSVEAIDCGPFESEFVVSVDTDSFFNENEWVLDREDGAGTGVWIEVERNGLDESNQSFEDSLCLTPDTKFRWTIIDTFGDGIFRPDPFTVEVNGEVIFTEPRNRWSLLEIRFITPSDPDTGSVLVLTPSMSPSISVMPSSSPTDSVMPSSGPTAYVCDNEDDDVLKISVNTDSNPYFNFWRLELKDENGLYQTIGDNLLSDGFTLYVDYFCLIPGRSYLWTLFDNRGARRGDGFECNPGECGYTVDLNGEEIVSGRRFFDEVVKEIGPVECVEEPGFHRVVNPKPGRNQFKRVYCSGVRKIIRQTGDSSVCALPLIDGSGNLCDKCKASCGFVGLGPCAE
jgi:hypothetical protein